MRNLKRRVSLLLVAALIISSISLGFGQIEANAISQATGQLGTYRLRVTTSAQDCDATGTANNLVVTINYSDGTSWSTTVEGESSPNYFEAGTTDTITFTSVPAKPISSITYDSQGSDRWKTDSSYMDYSPDGGTTWDQIALMGGFDGTGVRTFSYPSTYSLNTSSLNHVLTFNAAGGTGGCQIYSEYGATLPASNIPTVTWAGHTFNGWYPSIPGTGPGTDATYTALWTANAYHVAYNGNGATGGSMANSVHLYDAAKALTQNAYTKTGYSFAGWATSPTGSSAYTDQQSVINLTAINGGTVNLYAVWTSNTYSVVYNGNGNTGGSVPNSIHCYDTAQALSINSYTKTGYTFAGWATSQTGPVVYSDGQIVINLTSINGAAVTLYAQWAPITYTIVYDANGGSGTTASSTHTYDVPDTLSLNGFTRTGYTFRGWAISSNGFWDFEDGQTIINLSVENGSVITFYAMWIANVYTVTFDAQGGSVSPVTRAVAFGSPYNTYGGNLPTPTKTGYTFSGWYTGAGGSGSQIYSSTTVSTASNHTLYAKWVVAQVSFTWYPNGGTWWDGTTGPKTTTTTTPPMPWSVTRTGYTFSGWSPAPPAITPAEPMSFTAQWVANTYTVVYNGNGATGGSTANSSHSYGTAKALTVNGYTKTGHSFAGWATSPSGPVVYSDGQPVNNLTTISGATVTLYAMWTANTYTVIFDAQGGSVSPNSKAVVYGSTYGTLPTPAKIGYTFDGWYTDAAGGGIKIVDTTAVTISSEQILYANWIDFITVNITFDANGGTGGSSALLTYGEPLNAPAVTKEGYTLIGWLPAVPPTVPNADTTYTAQWGLNVAITFDAGGGTGGTSSIKGAGGVLTAPAVAKAGYTFAGWSPEVPAAVPSVDTTYTAQWSANTYTINYNGNGSTAGSTANSSHTYDIASNLTTNGFTKTGYSFLGWSADSGAASATYTNGQSVINLTQSPSTIITFFAVWSVNQYTITFVPNNSFSPTTITQNYNTTVTKPTDPTKTGYTFAGWFSDIGLTNAVVWPYTIVGNITFYAKWIENISGDYTYQVVNSSTVTIVKYNGAGGAVTIPETIAGYPVTEIGANAFMGCHTLTNITIGSNVVKIGYFTFDNCTGLLSVSIPNNVKTIDYGAFHACKSMTSVTIGSGVETIGVRAFASCTKLTQVFVDGSNNYFTVQDNVLFNKTKTTLVMCPGGKTGDYVIPDGVVNIYNNAFDSCSALTSLTISANVTTIGTDAFSGCYAISRYIVDSGSNSFSAQDDILFNKAKTVLIQCPVNKAGYYSIPNTVTEIGTKAFYVCQQLTGVTLPESLLTIGTNAFTICTKLAGAYFLGNAPNIGTNVFSGCASGFTVYYLSGKTGFTSPTWNGYPASVFTPAGTQCTITFDSNGGSAVTAITQDANTTVSKPTDPVKTGYSLAGWYSDAGLTTAVSWPYTLTGDVTFYAKWTANTYTVTFDAQGGSVSPATITVTYAGTYGTLPSPTRTSYTFGGWYTGAGGTGTRIYSSTTVAITSAQTLYAKWAITQYTVSFYCGPDFDFGMGPASYTCSPGTIVYPDQIGVIPDPQTYGSPYGLPPQRDGDTFLGWAFASDRATAVHTFVMPENNVTLYAVWESETPLITFYANGGTGGTSTYMHTGSPLTAPIVIRTGYTFTGWSPSVPSTVPATDTTYVAQWSVNSYTITFDSNGGLPVTPVTQNYNTTVAKPTDPTKTGYTFTGWFTNPSLTTAVVWPYTMGASNVTFYAGWTHTVVYITWNPNGGRWEDGSNDSRTTTSLDCPGALTRAGYSFDGWTPAVPYSMPTVDTTFTAQWVANSYTITFDANGGVGGTSTSMLYGSALIPPTVTRAGYTFIGWSPEVPATVPAYDATYTAQWSINNATVTIFFDSHGGPPIEPISGHPGDPIPNIQIPNVNGYIFMGFSPALPSCFPDEDMTVSVLWNFEQFTVTFDANGGVGSAEPITQDYGTSVAKPADPTKVGYTFAGWYADAGLTNAVAWPYTMEASDVTFYAKWTVSTVHFTVSSASGMTGDTITVSVTVSENSNLGAITLVVPYDPAVLEVVSYSAGSILNGFALDVNNNETALTITLAAARTTKLTAGGSILDIQFRIKGSAPTGTISTGAYISELTDTETPANALPFDITQGSITVVCKLGDINGSGTVTAVDALMVLQAATGRITLTAEQMLAADVNKSGTVTALDALMILQYATGKLTSFG